MASIRKKGRSFKVGIKVGGSGLILPSSIVGADQINFLAIERHSHCAPNRTSDDGPALAMAHRDQRSWNVAHQ